MEFFHQKTLLISHCRFNSSLLKCRKPRTPKDSDFALLIGSEPREGLTKPRQSNQASQTKGEQGDRDRKLQTCSAPSINLALFCLFLSFFLPSSSLSASQYLQLYFSCISTVLLILLYLFLSSPSLPCIRSPCKSSDIFLHR